MICISINFKGKKFKVKQEIVHIRFKDIEMKTLNLQKKKIDTISNLVGLKKLLDLEALILDDNKITEIDLISNLKNLKFLSLKNNNISSVKNIEGLTNLVELNLAGNEITDISGLINLPNLQVLHLENNKITEINNLESLQNLEYLYLDYNQITEIKNLEKIKRLTLLNLNNNQITEVKSINESRVLRKLSIRNNQITKIHPIHLQYLDEFEISGNPIHQYLKSRFANINAKKITEYSVNPEGIEKRLKVGGKNIYIPIDYSNLAHVLPKNEEILYSTLCNATEVVIVPGNPPRNKKIRWKAHLLITKSGFGITIGEESGEIGAKFFNWHSVPKLKGKFKEGSVKYFVNTIKITRVPDFETLKSFNNRLKTFPEFFISQWEEARNK